MNAAVVARLGLGLDFRVKFRVGVRLGLEVRFRQWRIQVLLLGVGGQNFF